MFLLLFLKKRDLKQFLANPLSSIFISIFFVQVLYHLYTGGDAWDNIVMPNRFLSSALPFLLILFSLMLSQLISSRGVNSASNIFALFILIAVFFQLLLKSREPVLFNHFTYGSLVTLLVFVISTLFFIYNS